MRAVATLLLLAACAGPPDDPEPPIDTDDPVDSIPDVVPEPGATGHTGGPADSGDTDPPGLSGQIVFVIDITGSWGEAGFSGVRHAMDGALDALLARRDGPLEAAVVLFSSRYAWLYTELTPLDADAEPAALRSAWGLLSMASKAGSDASPTDGVACVLHGFDQLNDFSSPPGGCYPAMPREYRDETGTDHSVGLAMARQLFGQAAPATSRDVVVITDGSPNTLHPTVGTHRALDGYVEMRWRELVGPVPRASDAIVTAAGAEADALHTTHGADLWVISWVVDHPILDAITRGAGTKRIATTSAAIPGLLDAVLDDIAAPP